MRRAHKAKPAPAVTGNGLRKSDQPGRPIDPEINIARLKGQPGRLRDRFGHFYHDRVLDNWSPKACIAMRLHRVVEARDE